MPARMVGNISPDLERFKKTLQGVIDLSHQFPKDQVALMVGELFWDQIFSALATNSVPNAGALERIMRGVLAAVSFSPTGVDTQEDYVREKIRRGLEEFEANVARAKEATSPPPTCDIDQPTGHWE